VSAESLEPLVECVIQEDFGVGLAELAAMQPLLPTPAPPVLPAEMVAPPALAVPAPPPPRPPGAAPALPPIFAPPPPDALPPPPPIPAPLLRSITPLPAPFQSSGSLPP